MADPAFLIDSNIFIYVLRDAHGSAASRLGECTLGSAVTSMIVYAEVMRGFATAGPEGIVEVERLFDLIAPLPFDRKAADIYMRLPFRRASFDRLIAAHALSLDLTLITNDESDFRDIPGLRVENWAI
ncbi:MAG: type II toxin-antitoxin system VapC family toxin [Rhizorhabdus sp.]|uniref:type II toxin-antitoxin system VapC family toxin n=1 Tax=Rhizorhabdus sp. TaxID=1968843 RepID=UPI001B5983DC|nr:type II toxin-antitoxin system VapC family toxin [Rhizorhabdus sp.]MBP8231365.1 type II toxin-antitoxin system VapC family toxin [Rhizorhabdus sp.]